MTIPTTSVVSCTCKHEYQDSRYGKGKRLASLKNKTVKPGARPFYACTVCKSLHN